MSSRITLLRAHIHTDHRSHAAATRDADARGPGGTCALFVQNLRGERCAVSSGNEFNKETRAKCNPPPPSCHPSPCGSARRRAPRCGVGPSPSCTFRMLRLAARLSVRFNSRLRQTALTAARSDPSSRSRCVPIMCSGRSAYECGQLHCTSSASMFLILRDSSRCKRQRRLRCRTIQACVVGRDEAWLS